MEREVTVILQDLAAGKQSAAAELLPIVYAELRRLAGAQMRRLGPGQTLQPTALVHEAYLKLVGADDPAWDGRRHFFGAAAQAMREIVVDSMRRRAAVKRGGGRANEELEAGFTVAAEGMSAADVLAVDSALKKLESEHPRKAQIVVMRYFGGFTVEEIAATLDITSRTVEREWRFARAFLYEAIEGEAE